MTTIVACRCCFSAGPKWSSIYDIHKKFRLLTTPPCQHERIGNQVLYSDVLIRLTLHGRHAFTATGVRLKQKFSFSNFCPGRGLNPGPRSLMAVNVTNRLRRHLQTTATPPLTRPTRLRKYHVLIGHSVTYWPIYYKGNLYSVGIYCKFIKWCRTETKPQSTRTIEPQGQQTDPCDAIHIRFRKGHC